VGLSMLPGGRLEPLGSSTCGLGLVIADAIPTRRNDNRARSRR
jgi:hypothetical protein